MHILTIQQRHVLKSSLEQPQQKLCGKVSGYIFGPLHNTFHKYGGGGGVTATQIQLISIIHRMYSIGLRALFGTALRSP